MTDMREVAKFEIAPTEMVSEGSWGSRSVGKHPSTMTLYAEQRTHLLIEWEIPDLEQVEQIGLWFEDKTLVDYDGVFSLPREAVAFLRQQGFTVPAEFEE